tara:strand:+ start:596 stop:820 length:225 start_codon:yes stop_codon:yes gene_type:complete
MANGAMQEKRTQLNFLDGAMENLRENFEDFAEIFGLSPEEVESKMDLAESMFDDVYGAVENFATSKKAVRNQDG